MTAEKGWGVVLAPTTEFVRRGDGHLAYQVFGDGPANVLEISGFASHREQVWQWPVLVRSMERMALLARVAQYDWRGYGMSDPLPASGYSIEDLAADAVAVLDAAGLSEATLWGAASGGAVAIWLAVHCPDRVSGLILDNASACRRAHPDYSIGLTDEQIARSRSWFESNWGTGATIALVGAKFADDERARADWARFERMAATPGGQVAIFDMVMTLDVRNLLLAVAVPTLVFHSVSNTLYPVSQGRYLAEHIPGAKYIEIDTDVPAQFDDPVYRGDVSEFLTGNRTAADLDRSLAVLLFTDIVGSTDHAVAVGDTTWRGLLDQFRRAVRSVLTRYGAREINTRGDDFFAVISTPSIAVDVARSIRSEAASLDIHVRTGIHLGEVEHQGDDYTGISVHVAARIAALANPDEILISQAVRDAVLGSAIECSGHGTHYLKGVPNELELFCIEN